MLLFVSRVVMQHFPLSTHSSFFFFWLILFSLLFLIHFVYSSKKTGKDEEDKEEKRKARRRYGFQKLLKQKFICIFCFFLYVNVFFRSLHMAASVFILAFFHYLFLRFPAVDSLKSQITGTDLHVL